MKRMLIFIAGLGSMLLAHSSTYFVDASKADDTGTATNWASAKQSIQAAVNLASAGDTVLVTNGVYNAGSQGLLGYFLKNRLYVTRPITVQSVNGPDVTIIEGGGDSALRCGYLSNNAKLIGFTLTNGLTRGSGDAIFDQSGGGLFIRSGTVVSNCIIAGNHAIEDGGGVYFYGGGLLIDSVVRNNQALRSGSSYDGTGGGICTYKGGEIERCRLTQNSARYGGGIMSTGGLLEDARVNVGNTLIDNNSATWSGGGIYAGLKCVFNLNNSTVVDNTANGGGGLFASYTNTVGVYNSIVYNNTSTGSGYEGVRNIFIWTYVNSVVFTATYTCSAPLQEGFGNIDTNPLFADPENSDWTLRVGSPCIDAGQNGWVYTSNDLNGLSRIIDGRFVGGASVDMGAYEYDPWSIDYDDDSMSDGEEFVADTDPTDPESLFAITSISNNIYNMINFNTSSSRVYSVYGCTNLATGEWVPRSTPKMGSGHEDSVVVSNAPSVEFYKVLVDFP